MNQQEYQQRLLDREVRYPEWRPLLTDRPVHIHVDPEYADTYAGQVATITAASLFGRMSKSVSMKVPSVPVLSPLPWVGEQLDVIAMRTVKAADPFGLYEQRPSRPGDLRVVLGADGDGLVVHGSGWSAYFGRGPSPIPQSDELNPFGAAFAVVAAGSQLGQDMETATIEPVLVDTYTWSTGLAPSDAATVTPHFDLGELWCIGAGSVGSCALFFLGLVTKAFRAILIDRDIVEVENVRRSALFKSHDALNRKAKVEVAGRWLNEVGVQQIETYFAWLDEMPERWIGRETGTPDILISAANERSVRPHIENGFPPIQVYGTTGRNWQSTLFRHIPLKDACSLCVPGTEAVQLPALCATAPPASTSAANEDDVALPFLSYAAGLMTAAEIAKVAVTGRAVGRNRVFFEPRTPTLVRGVTLNRKAECVCGMRNASVHRAAIRGSRFAPLSSKGLE